MKYHEHNQQCFTVLHAPAPPPADRSSPEHEHNSAPWFMSVSIYPFKKNWTTVRTNLHDNLLKLSSGNAETPSHRGMHRSDRKTSEKWVQMMQCVKFLWSWILCAWKFLFFLTIGNFLHNFSLRFPKGLLLTCCYVISLKEFLEALDAALHE